jgi:acyl-CoA reductase-like NAD-dependent aldehyde dehydrogenase
MTTQGHRLAVMKTYKMFIGGAFPRSESGRYLRFTRQDGTFMGNLCHASRKDYRDAIGAAQKAQPGWAKRTAFNRAQILYRMAEMLESRREGFARTVAEACGLTAEKAAADVAVAIDRLVHFAGWCDKFEQVFGGTNPVASNHFNVSTIEPLGVVTILGSRSGGLAAIVTAVAPVIATGNAVVVVVEGAAGFAASEFAEVLGTSDLPGGVVNILTGPIAEVLPHVASHGDNDGVFGIGLSDDERRTIGQKAADTVKRTHFVTDPGVDGWSSDHLDGPWWMQPFVEVKTAWHPLGL